MRITPLNFFNPNNYPQKKTGRFYNFKFGNLQKDTVNFNNIRAEVPEDIQLYRCIGKEEYQKLLRGGEIESSGYATSDPMGWHARNWSDGFVPLDSYSECYFITFKIGQFDDIMDKRDYAEDTRYRIINTYSLKDISNIRKGYNVHGELVWAEDFEKAKAEDVFEKTQQIAYLTALLKSNNPKLNKREIQDELLSYKKEFPQIEI